MAAAQHNGFHYKAKQLRRKTAPNYQKHMIKK